MDSAALEAALAAAQQQPRRVKGRDGGGGGGSGSDSESGDEVALEVNSWWLEHLEDRVRGLRRSWVSCDEVPSHGRLGDHVALVTLWVVHHLARVECCDKRQPAAWCIPLLRTAESTCALSSASATA